MHFTAQYEDNECFRVPLLLLLKRLINLKLAFQPVHYMVITFFSSIMRTRFYYRDPRKPLINTVKLKFTGLNILANHVILGPRLSYLIWSFI